jgi:hypothetical protein
VLLESAVAKLTVTTVNLVNQLPKLNLENTVQLQMFQFITQLVKSWLSLVMEVLKEENTVAQSSGRLYEKPVHQYPKPLKIADLAKFWLNLKMFADVNALHVYQLNHQLVQIVTNSNN